MSYRPRRSMLFMPASNARALEKAKDLSADGFIFDLEDSVSPDDKAIALEQACEAVRSGSYGEREIVVRVNAHDTQWGASDIQTVAKVAPDAVLAPKVSTANDVYFLSQALDHYGAPKRTKLWVMMETSLAILNAGEIAKASQMEGNRLACMAMGTNDLSKETRAHMTPDRLPMMSWLSTCVVAARAYGLSILDTVYNDFKNQEGFRRECEQGLQLGMDGKTLIHPSQISIANDVFSPSDEEVAWSRRVVAAFQEPENEKKGVISIDGKMVERLHAEIAQRVVDMADVIETLNKQGRQA